MTGFGGRLRALTAERGRLCVGVDPHPELLRQWGYGVDAVGLRSFTEICAEAFGAESAVIKPQVAFFEPYAAEGFSVLADLMAACRSAGALVVADAKRGDIGSTMTAYVRAWLGESSPLRSDAITLSPYLGFGSLAPALDVVHSGECAIFVLARTSNAEGDAVQTAVRDGRTTAQAMVDQAARVNTDGRGSVGVVVGATREHGLDVGSLAGPILAPGLGAQGARSDDLPGIFADADHSWLVPAASRSILRAGPDVAALREAFRRTRDEVESVLRP